MNISQHYDEKQLDIIINEIMNNEQYVFNYTHMQHAKFYYYIIVVLLYNKWRNQKMEA
jgi:hypothetical protein